jgi:hypothetical protein
VPPVRASVCDSSDDQFRAQVDALKAQYPQIGIVVDELCEVLRFGYSLPQFLVDPHDSGYPNVYLVRVDYPPLGAAGAGKFLVTYHATEPMMSMNRPYQTFTLLSIEVRDP